MKYRFHKAMQENHSAVKGMKNRSRDRCTNYHTAGGSDPEGIFYTIQ